jgi:mercuric ion binding protein
MRTLIHAAAVLAVLGTSAGAIAAERTVTLAVENMTCVTCPYIVRESLEAVTGVSAVEVSFEDKTAIVTFDDEETDIAALTEATTNAGYPSEASDEPGK